MAHLQLCTASKGGFILLKGEFSDKQESPALINLPVLFNWVDSILLAILDRVAYVGINIQYGSWQLEIWWL